MMFQRRNTVFHCVAGDVLVLLDVAADRYLMPTGRLAAAYSEVANGREVSQENREALSRLVGQGLMVPVTNSPPELLPRTAPATAAINIPAGRPRLRNRVAAAVSLLRVGWRRRKRGIQHLGANEATRVSLAIAQRSDVGTLVAAFDAVAKPLPREGRCLWRSFALADLLNRHGHICDVVVGVKVRPFAAHCWVEWNGLLLDERPETIAPFTPIYRQ